MAVFNEPNRIGDVLKREFDTLLNRETVTLLAGQNLVVGAVVGKITASGKYRSLNNGGADGAQTAAGVLLFDCDATAADTKCVILARGPAVVATGKLGFNGADGTQTANATAALAALGIVARANV